MSLTRVDCYQYHGRKHLQDEGSLVVALNPALKPGNVVLAGSCSVRDSLGSQVATKLALQHFIEGILDFFGSPEGFENGEAADALNGPVEKTLKALEAAFKNANTSVYNFGHKLAAGGRMAAALLGLILDDKSIGAGRVGSAAAYLWREGEVFPFFEQAVSTEEVVTSEGFVGSQSMVSVELASVPIKAGDVVLVFSQTLDAAQERELQYVLSDLVPENQEHVLSGGRSSPALLDDVIRCVFTDPESLEFGMMANIGPETVFLRTKV